MKDVLSSTLFKRTLSAAILAPLVIGLIYAGGFYFIGLLIVLAGIAVYEWVQLSRKTRWPWALGAGGVIYIAFSFLCAYTVRENFGLFLTFLFLVSLWASDVGAYVFGKMIGGAKMAPAISPNKTWAGLLGAVVFSVATCLIFGFFEGNRIYPIDFIFVFFGGVIALSGQVGDLLVSKLKRLAKEKDSGHLIPGHGGLLDRIDSLLLATPVFLLLIWGFFDLLSKGGV